ncbi:hypothetical protein C0J52_01817, partial [Blattella germanica]
DPDYPLISIQGAQVSRCPIEDGVVYTRQWGTVSPGVVLAALAAALEPQNVSISLILTEPDPVNDTEEKVEKFERYKVLSLSAVLDNIWASTLAGEVPNIRTMNFARVLSYNSLDAVQISDEKLEEFSQNAIKAYENHLSNLMSGLYCETSKPYPRVHLNVIIDGTWSTNEAIRVLTQIAEHNDVSHFGSSIAVMNGEDGSWILEESHSITSLFKIAENTTDNSSTVTWPTNVRFVYLASEINQNRFKELSTVDSQFPDSVVTSTDKNIEAMVYNIVDITSTVRLPARFGGIVYDPGEFHHYYFYLIQ